MLDLPLSCLVHACLLPIRGCYQQGTRRSAPRHIIGAIREALLSGDKMKAIKLYRNVYGVGLKEAQDALDAM